MMRHSPLPFLVPLLLAGCDGVQSISGNDGRQGEIVSGLFWIFLAVTIIVYAIVIAFLVFALVRRRGRRQDGHADEGELKAMGLKGLLVAWIANAPRATISPALRHRGRSRLTSPISPAGGRSAPAPSR